MLDTQIGKFNRIVLRTLFNKFIDIEEHGDEGATVAKRIGEYMASGFYMHVAYYVNSV